ncbi:MAG: helix-turn-helix transcriptional regulator [Pseudohongiellaceae bacterium]
MIKKQSTGAASHYLDQMVSLAEFRRERRRDFDSLTGREKEVLILVADGLDNTAISARLQITRVTVQNHRASIRQKLDISSQTGYTKFALAFDLIGF